jgi:hypothetical protein
MDTVKQFENELNSIWDFRPPVSKAKMASITKLAMKSHKYYKHIVMLVEKFISKVDIIRIQRNCTPPIKQRKVSILGR